MIYILFAITLIIALFAWNRSSILMKEMQRLNREIKNLKEKLLPEESAQARLSEEAESPLPSEESPQEAPVMEAPRVEAVKPPVSRKIGKAKTPQQKKERNQVFSQQILNRWIGILGTLILVAGISFLAVYSTMRMEAFGKFLTYLLLTLTVFGGTYFSARNEKWRPLSLWLRSGAGAIVLFLSIGAGSIPGLQWVQDPITGVLLIGGAVAMNLTAGYTGKKELIAVIHILMSITTLAIAPAAGTTLLIAVIISLAGIILSWRHRWNWNLIFISAEFFLFHSYWFYRLGTPSSMLQIQGLSYAALVFLVTLLIHYRPIYGEKDFALLPFLTHFLNWVMLGSCILLYNVVDFQSLHFLGIALVAYLISRRARKLGIPWLRMTDSLTAELFLILAVLNLQTRGFNLFNTSSFLFWESLLFLFILVWEKERVIQKIAYILTLVTGGFMLMTFAIGLSLHELGTIPGVFLLISYAASLAVYLALQFRKEEKGFARVDQQLYSLLGLLPSFLILSLFLLNKEALWSPWLIPLMAFPLQWLRMKNHRSGMTAGLLILLGAGALSVWGQMAEMELASPQKWIYTGGLFLAALSAIYFSDSQKYQKKMTLWGVLLLQLNLIVTLIHQLPESRIPHLSLFFLLMIVLHSEALGLFKRRILSSSPFRTLPYEMGESSILYLIAFGLLYLFEIFPSSERFLKIPHYLWIGTAALGVLFTWMLRGRQKGIRPYYRRLHSLLTELFYALFLLLLLWKPTNENSFRTFFNTPWQHLAMAALSIGALLADRYLMRPRGKNRLYSLVFFWLSMIFMLNTDSTLYHSESFKGWIPWIFAAGTILLQGAYLFLSKAIPEK